MIESETIVLTIVQLGVAPTLGRLARWLACDVVELRRAIDELVVSGIVELWDHPLIGPRVAPTPWLAERLGIVPDGRSRHWRMANRPGRCERIRLQPQMEEVDDHDEEVYAYSPRPHDPDGMPWPTLLLGSRQAWPLAGQSRRPAGPALSPADDPRGVATLYGGACPACGGRTLNPAREYCLGCDRPGHGGKVALEPRKPRRKGLRGGRGA